MKIIESTCGECGAKDRLFPVPDEDPPVWKCTECGAVFEEEKKE
jgi:rubredoxin